LEKYRNPQEDAGGKTDPANLSQAVHENRENKMKTMDLETADARNINTKVGDLTNDHQHIETSSMLDLWRQMQEFQQTMIMNAYE